MDNQRGNEDSGTKKSVQDQQIFGFHGREEIGEGGSMRAVLALVHQVFKCNIKAVVLVLSWGDLISHAAYRKIARLHRCWIGGLSKVNASDVKVGEKAV
jgi:hypothetical protein